MSNVWVNGCFDLIHQGHLELLSYAAGLGDRLIVGIDSDYRIKLSKGSSRPINSQDFRRNILKMFKIVDKVYVFDTDYQLEQYIRQTEPDVMVVGIEYMGKRVIGAEFAKKLLFFQKVDGLSTSQIIKNIK